MNPQEEFILRSKTPAKVLAFNYLKKLINHNFTFENSTLALIPWYGFSMYNIDTKEWMSDTYHTRYGFDHIKIKPHGVAEYYRMSKLTGYSFISYELNTLVPKERYKTPQTNHMGSGACEQKYSLDGKLLQTNYFAYDVQQPLPQDFIDDLEDFQYKNKIFVWARKPYGRIVEFYGRPTLFQ